MNQKLFIIISHFLIIITFSFLNDCKKSKGVDSVEWKDESLRLTSDLCSKYRACADPDWNGVPDKMKEYSKTRLEESNCQKQFRNSNAYKLIGAEPLIITSAYRDCYKKIMSFSCAELKEGKIDQLSECKTFQKIQSL